MTITKQEKRKDNAGLQANQMLNDEKRFKLEMTISYLPKTKDIKFSNELYLFILFERKFDIEDGIHGRMIEKDNTKSALRQISR